jgi:hypothetical protein
MQIMNRLGVVLIKYSITQQQFMAKFKSAIIKYPPDTVFLMFICVSTGVVQLFIAREVLTRMPLWIFIGWSILLILGGGTSLVGILWPNPPVGFLIEGAGRSMLWPASLAYAFLLFRYDHDWYGGGLVVIFALVCYSRSLYVRFVYTEWQSLLEKHK